MRLLGLPPKLRLTPLWPALAAVLTATTFLWLLLPSLLERSASVQLRDSLRILAPILAGASAGQEADLQSRVRAMAADSGLRITLVRSDGTVIADSARDAAEVAAMENHAEREEIRGALATG
ncbi:MAG TPA: hypothetical protein VJ885_12010, partial [Thermoanaerobaculia bacterium]|nr:hypothetical protein [Thermoanaerobaculia bacterium]